MRGDSPSESSKHGQEVRGQEDQSSPAKRRKVVVDHATGQGFNKPPENPHRHVTEGMIPQIDLEGVLDNLEKFDHQLLRGLFDQFKNTNYKTEEEACRTLRDHIKKENSTPTASKVLSAAAIITDAVHKLNLPPDLRKRFNTEINSILSNKMTQDDLKYYLPLEMQRGTSPASDTQAEGPSAKDKGKGRAAAASSEATQEATQEAIQEEREMNEFLDNDTIAKTLAEKLKNLSYMKINYHALYKLLETIKDHKVIPGSYTRKDAIEAYNTIKQDFKDEKYDEYAKHWCKTLGFPFAQESAIPKPSSHALSHEGTSFSQNTTDVQSRLDKGIAPATEHNTSQGIDLSIGVESAQIREIDEQNIINILNSIESRIFNNLNLSLRNIASGTQKTIKEDVEVTKQKAQSCLNDSTTLLYNKTRSINKRLKTGATSTKDVKDVMNSLITQLLDLKGNLEKCKPIDNFLAEVDRIKQGQRAPDASPIAGP